MDGQRRPGVKPTSTTLGFDYLMTSLARLELSGDVSKEYAKLPTPHNFPCKVGKSESVAKKNRYKDLIPYDHNRVVLSPQTSSLIDAMDESGDYINASFIRGYTNNDGYIATQGPMLGTVEDFWSLVWSENSRLIAMLCRIVERCQNQSYKYWPEVGECLDVDDVIIKTDVEDDRGTHIIRKIGLRHMKTGERRDVIHLQFLAWPDNSLPCLPTFLTFWKTFRKYKCPSSGLPIIHCSNGSHRTGLLIALDSLFTQWEVTSTIDVVCCVVRMREDRVGFFPTENEYRFLYHSAVEAYMSHQTDRPMESFHRTDSLGQVTNEAALKTKDIHREFSFIDMQRTNQSTDPRLITCNTNGNVLFPDLSIERPFQSYQLQFPCDTGSMYVTAVPMCHQTIKKQMDEYPIRLRHSVSLQEHEVFLGIGGVL
ncbi:tyrosine-protein phosphatase non-receptor type 6, partial [Biomphalaria pfeifferi]